MRIDHLKKHFYHTLWFICLFSLESCQHSEAPKIDNYFSFNSNEIQELTLIKSETNQDNPWLATVRKYNSQWNIISTTPEKSFLDNEADSIFIQHLIDSFRSIQLTSNPLNGPLESFGLKPPQIAFRLKAPHKTIEFQIGYKTQNEKSRYFTLDGEKIYLMNGSTLPLIDRVQSFHSLRKYQWMNMDVDDVDEIELRYQSHIFLYAQREGDVWTNRQHKPINIDIDSWITPIIQSQAVALIDLLAEAEQIKNKILSSKETYELILMDRAGKKSFLKIQSDSPRSNRVYGINSTRPKGVFELNSRILFSLKSKCYGNML